MRQFLRRLTEYRWVYGLAAMALVACAALPPAKTFEQRSLYTENGITALAESVTASLMTGAISPSDARLVQAVLRPAHDAVGLAEDAFAGGDITTAEERLRLAEALLLGVRQRLASKLSQEDRP